MKMKITLTGSEKAIPVLGAYASIKNNTSVTAYATGNSDGGKRYFENLEKQRKVKYYAGRICIKHSL